MKNQKKKKKDSQLLIRINKEQRNAFLSLCEDQGTDGAKLIRRFIDDYLKKHGKEVD